MLKIIILLFAAWFNIILCEMQSQITANQQISSSCKYPPLCYLSDKTYRKESRNILSPLPYSNLQNYVRLERSYNNGFDLSASPAYYPAFDSISVLASLAFLAFLLQSFASLFDRSRSILPTIVSGRQQSAVDSRIPEISKHVSHALRQYENLNKNLNVNQ